ncbi:hypothetical protein GA0074692_4501 [Micromonospora pallida]|uniref:Secreted protein n=1 Tax=Micromonospora pallida TaxID=145854 RepID=A0A1C6T533_9ACTN|nr:hypothetical protein [Micromonospora pallida]SCL36946.1 hypothetical protein GA0074692_4501 [Micromonospora pallida]
MRAGKVIAGAIMTCGIMLTGIGIASPAMAASGTAFSTDAGAAGASTRYNDDGDIYTACDLDADGTGAVGWIEVRQADGSWNKYPERYVGGGAGSCSEYNANIARESADVRIVACRQNGPTANPQDCGRHIVPGA